MFKKKKSHTLTVKVRHCDSCSQTPGKDILHSQRRQVHMIDHSESNEHTGLTSKIETGSKMESRLIVSKIKGIYISSRIAFSLSTEQEAKTYIILPNSNL